MNKLKFLGLVGAACILSMSSCISDDWAQGAKGKGMISVVVDVDQSIASSSRTGSRAFADDGVVTVDDLAISLTSADGSYSNTWPSVAAFAQENPAVPIGTYTMDAYFGSQDSEGFNAPYFFGSASVKVVENETTPVTLVASLANTMFTVEYTETLKNYLTAYSAELQSAGSSTAIAYPANETRPAYLKAGMVDVYVNVEKPSGVKARLLAATVNAEPKHHYTVTIDINDGEAGQGVLVISFDDELTPEVFEIDLSDELLNSPAPVVEAEGFTSGDPVEVTEGSPATSPLVFDIIARGGIGKVKLATTNASAISSTWPEEIDLMEATAAQQAEFTSLGLSVKGLWKNPDKMAVVDFTKLVKNIKIARGEETASVEFSMTVVDAFGKACEEPVVLSITVVKEKIEIAPIADADLLLGNEEYTFLLTYNGQNPEQNVTIQYLNARGTWSDMQTLSCVDNGDGTYNVTIAVDSDSNYTLRAKNAAGTVISDSMTVKRIASKNYAITGSNVWATKAYIMVAEASGPKEGTPYADYATVYVAADGGAYEEADTEVVGDYVMVKDLTPATTYNVKASLSYNEAECCDPITITTEAAAQLPNGDMEEWGEKIPGLTNYWWVDVPPTGWGSLNALTTSEGGNGTSSSNHTGASYCAYSGTQPVDGGHTGKAAYIATVGWGSGNQPYTTRSGNFLTGYRYSGAVCKNVTAGELFIGSYDADGKKADYGQAFASRPTAMSFYYKYTAKNPADRGYALVKVLDADGNVIATGEANLAAATAYTEASVDLVYDNPETAPSAASVQVLFRSSADPETYCVFGDSKNASSTSGNDPNLTYPGYNNWTNGRYTGSQLYIDDVTLKY